MQATTLCFLVKEGEVVLAMKKRGFGAGKWNGVGGKVEPGEDIKESARREIKEEAGVEATIDGLELVGRLEFLFDGKHQWDQEVWVFLVHAWVGDPCETEEMQPRWYRQEQLPFAQMWVDDPYWVPLVLAGKKIKARFLFGEDGAKLLDFSVNEVPTLPS